MLKRTALAVALGLALIVGAGCAKEDPVSVGGDPSLEEQSYDLVGIIVSRDVSKNELTVDHEEIPGYMAAMTMPYEVRGQNVAELPADGSPITGKVHATEEAYWLTDVTSSGPAPTSTDTTMTAIPSGTTDTAGTTTGAP